MNNLFGTVSGKKVTVLGYSFKSNTNDTRESPAIEICKRLIEEGANLSIYDPKVPSEKIISDLNLEDFSRKELYKQNVIIEKNLLDTITDSDAIIIITEWEDFERIDWKVVSKKMRSPAYLFDTRSIVNNKEVEKNGINLWKIGSSN